MVSSNREPQQVDLDPHWPLGGAQAPAKPAPATCHGPAGGRRGSAEGCRPGASHGARPAPNWDGADSHQDKGTQSDQFSTVMPCGTTCSRSPAGPLARGFSDVCGGGVVADRSPLSWQEKRERSGSGEAGAPRNRNTTRRSGGSA
jgi:hypothetical protein